MEKTETSVKINLPTSKELLQSGIQFGHEVHRWNPKMSKFIFGAKNNIHILDVEKTAEKLAEAAKFLSEAASRGNILFVGTKKQASEILKEEAIRSGAFFVNNRWAGGLFTNFQQIRKSLKKLNELERLFEEGVSDRTKYEVSLMKKEWQKLNRLYAGLKGLESRPTAVVVLDSKYERAAVKEARQIHIPIVGIVDTNADPEAVDYAVPANDDAIKSIRVVLKVFADAVLAGNKNNGIKHNLKDYSKFEVKITKQVAPVDFGEKVIIKTDSEGENTSVISKEISNIKPISQKGKVRGILERTPLQETKVVKNTKTVENKKEEKKEKEVVKKAKLAEKKVEEEKPVVKKAVAKKADPKAKKAAGKKTK